MSAFKFILFIFLTGITACTSSYTIKSRDVKFIPIQNETNDNSIEEKIKPYRDSLASQMNEIIGKSEMEMSSGQPESLLGNFVCDLVLQYHNGIKKLNDRLYFPTIVLLNYRGLRASLPAGDIKVKNIFEIMPFENAIVYVDLNGKDILTMSKFLVNYGGQPVSSNYKLIVEQNKTFQITINGISIDTNATYTVITTDYLSNGGDNMSFFEKAITKNETNYKLRNLLLDQIGYNTKMQIKNEAKLDGRITFK